MTRRLMGFLIAMLVVAGAYTGTVRATGSRDFTATTVVTGRFDEIDLKVHTIPADLWQLRLKTQGQTDLYVQSNVWKAGGSSGWHTHPGPSLIVITAGTVTNYESDDPTCTPHVYGPGTSLGPSFVDHGDDHAHIVRNETANEARGFAIQLIPALAGRRIDVPHPANCPLNID